MAKRNDWGEAHCKREIKRVCKYFGIPPCDLMYTNRKRSFYRPSERLIALGRRDFWKTQHILAHELAHHVHEMKDPPVRELTYDRFGRIRWKKASIHGKVFQYYLLRVVMLMYDTCSDYPWHQEYTQVRKAWENGRIG